MSRIRGKPFWLVPLMLALVVGVIGWWSNQAVRRATEQRLARELETAVNANVTALRIWMDTQIRLASAVVRDPALRGLAVDLARRAPELSDDGPRAVRSDEEAELGNRLRQALAGTGFRLASLVTTNDVIVGSSVPDAPFVGQSIHEEHRTKYAELWSTGEPVIITPFKLERFIPRFGRGRLGRRGGVGMGEGPPGPRTRELGETPTPPPPELSRQAADRRPPPGRLRERTFMQVAIPLRDDDGRLVGAMAFVVNPEDEFTRILSVASAGDSGETYAFDPNGLMINRSRFDGQLKALGVIPARPDASAALTLTLRDPGGDLTRGFSVPSDLPERPLVAMVASALQGIDGVEVKPFRDYRGVPVVGAWRWLPEHQFGVATQMDAAEAYQPLRVLARIILVLILLLLLSSVTMFVLSYASWVWRRRVKEAERRIKRLGQYTLEQKIGEGGMGVVYRACHALLRRDTAIKLLLPERADPYSVACFEREVQMTCRLSHPNTIQVYDYGRTPDGVFYYAMEFLRGLNLQDLVVRYGPQPEGRVVYILAQACESLAEAHAAGLIHRDLKPANVFLCSRAGIADWVKVLDFGLVKHSRDPSTRGEPPAEKLAGTPLYMAPESVSGTAVISQRSDIYSLGATAYYLLTGTNVFGGESRAEVLDKLVSESPAPPSDRLRRPVCRELEEVLLRCLAKDPDARPASVAELRALLLATPHANHWTVAQRTAWWATFVAHAQPEGAPTEAAAATDTEPTLPIDLVHRTPGH